MPWSPTDPPYVQLLATADATAAARPEVDPEMIREVFMEVVTLLHDGLVLDDLDEHDANAVVAALCEDLVTDDPGAAIRARAAAAPEADVHDRPAVTWVYERCL